MPGDQRMLLHSEASRSARAASENAWLAERHGRMLVGGRRARPNSEGKRALRGSISGETGEARQDGLNESIGIGRRGATPNGLEMSRPANSSILHQTRFAAAGRVGSIELLGGSAQLLLFFCNEGFGFLYQAPGFLFPFGP
jgi:hypothetical protein